MHGALPVPPGEYEVTLRSVTTECGVLPNTETQIWSIREHHGSYWVLVSGYRFDSSDGSYYTMQTTISMAMCPIDVWSTMAIASTDTGFVGQARLVIDKGVCGKCSDYAVIHGNAF